MRGTEEKKEKKRDGKWYWINKKRGGPRERRISSGGIRKTYCIKKRDSKEREKESEKNAIGKGIK